MVQFFYLEITQAVGCTAAGGGVETRLTEHGSGKPSREALSAVGDIGLFGCALLPLRAGATGGTSAASIELRRVTALLVRGGGHAGSLPKVCGVTFAGGELRACTGSAAAALGPRSARARIVTRKVCVCVCVCVYLRLSVAPLGKAH